MSAPACAHAHRAIGLSSDVVIEGRSGCVEAMPTVPTMPVCQQIEAALTGEQPTPGTPTHEQTT